jgi:hypothetical protein
MTWISYILFFILLVSDWLGIRRIFISDQEEARNPEKFVLAIQ